ncbi:potassium voltage-gated channel subfamily A member 2-like [Xenia sp. Carnegie-2017]|uniref:potassium voltage-gated channel subfamily A member 2-like n=1 Tax=Xenia sp. Carnegie-2017 TaxID=2897299 RepID=UPI001F03AFB0|nr:potassium voltage-gated channel subfamily A member 2-like [Xenia sp. Carnegie-2017]
MNITVRNFASTHNTHLKLDSIDGNFIAFCICMLMKLERNKSSSEVWYRSSWLTVQYITFPQIHIAVMRLEYVKYLLPRPHHSICVELRLYSAKSQRNLYTVPETDRRSKILPHRCSPLRLETNNLLSYFYRISIMFSGTASKPFSLTKQLDDASHRGSFLGTTHFQLTSKGSIELVDSVDQRFAFHSKTFVSGRRVKIWIQNESFETFEETLMRFPDTLLGSRRKRKQHYVAEKNAYVFKERNKFAFNAILFFYQSGGILAQPSDVPFKIFTNELEFFELMEYFPESWAFKTIPIEMPKQEWQKTLWKLFHDPKSSTIAMIISWISFLFIVITTFLFCFETTDYGYRMVCKNKGLVPNDRAGRCDHKTEWFIVDTIITTWFVIEYTAALVTAQHKLKFVFSVLGIIDCLSIVPYFAAMFVKKRHVTIRKLLRLTRVFRVLKLTHHIEALRLLGYTIHRCFYLIVGLMLLVAILTTSLSSLVLFAEKQSNSTNIISNLDSTWFVIITLTNVGYGDVVPITNLGKLIGAVAAVLGILIVFILPAPVLLNHFEEIYSIRKERNKLKKAGIETSE